MKRSITVLSLILIFTIVLNGCASQKPSKVIYDIESAESNNIYSSIISETANDGTAVSSETDFWTGMSFTKNNISQKTITVYGNSYCGSYSNSKRRKLNSYITDIYKDENDIEFGLRSGTEKLAHLNLMNAYFFDTEPYLPDVNDPEKIAIDLATKIAEDFVADITQYARIVEEPKTSYKERNGKKYSITYYTIVFAKKICGYFSSDYISIKVTSKGNLASIMTGDLNAFDNISLKIDVDNMNRSISDKITTSFQDFKLRIYSTNIIDQKLVLTPEGNVCMYSSIGAILDNEFGDTTRIGILTYLT